MSCVLPRCRQVGTASAPWLHVRQHRFPRRARRLLPPIPTCVPDVQHVRDEKTTGTAVAPDAVYVEQVNTLLTAASDAIYEEIKMMRCSPTMDTSSTAYSVVECFRSAFKSGTPPATAGDSVVVCFRTSFKFGTTAYPWQCAPALPSRSLAHAVRDPVHAEEDTPSTLRRHPVYAEKDTLFSLAARPGLRITPVTSSS